MTTLTPDKVIEMFVKSVGMRLGLYLSQPSNNIILLLPRVPTRKKQNVMYCTLQYKPVKMLDVDVNKDPVKAPQNLAANLLEVLGEGNVFCHRKN